MIIVDTALAAAALLYTLSMGQQHINEDVADASEVPSPSAPTTQPENTALAVRRRRARDWRWFPRRGLRPGRAPIIAGAAGPDDPRGALRSLQGRPLFKQN